MTLIGKLICAARKLLRVKKVHKFGKPITMPDSLWQALGSPDPRPRNKVCTTCGLIKSVKPRKPRKQETEK